MISILLNRVKLLRRAARINRFRSKEFDRLKSYKAMWGVWSSV